MNNDILSLGKSLKKGFGKKAMSTLIAGSLLFSSGAVMNAEAYSMDEPSVSFSDYVGYTGIKVFVNGRFVEFNSSTGYPTQVNGVTYVPLKTVAEAFNAHYSEQDKSAFISKHGAELKIRTEINQFSFVEDLSNQGDAWALIVGKDTTKSISIDGKAFINDGKFYISVRTLFEMFGAKVTWNGETKTIFVENDYSKNSEYIDFKDKKVLEMKDVDIDKKYSSITYDGVSINNDYLKLLKNCNQYKIIEDNDKLYIFSYQYLMDVNYIYEAHLARKLDLENSSTYYNLWSISEAEKTFVRKLSMIDGYASSYGGLEISKNETGDIYQLRTEGDANAYSYVDSIVDEIVSEVKKTTSNPSEIVKIVDKRLRDMLTPIVEDSNMLVTAGDVYNTLKNRTAVCQGYARTFKYIMDKLEIPCIKVSGFNKGSTVAHVWNEVYVNGEWVAVDVFSNDLVSRDWILLTDIDSPTLPAVINKEDVKELELVKLTLRMWK